MARTLPRRAVAGLLAASLLLVVSAPAHAEVVSIRPEIQPFGSIGVYDGGLTPVQVSETFRSSAGTDPTPATIVSLTFTGPDAAAFSNVGTSCKPGNSVSGGCVMNLLFNPTHAGLHQATLTINHTGENGPITRSLTGTGLLDPPNIEGGPLDFGPVLTGTTKRSVVFLQRALKTAPLTIASMTIVGPNAAEFFFGERTADCEVGTVVSRHVEGGFGEPGERCFKEVVFNPATRGVKDASVRITFQGTDYVKTVPLVAEGLAEAQLGAPASVDFGALEVGRMTARPLVLTNVGDRPLTIGSLVFAGALDFFAAPDGCTGAALAPGSSCTV
ncbi:MAG TPA: choice-of-anchor D domain-containing protein, partial [Solirubrobacteraceae bacterium]